jgi:hypothetical protein
LIRVPLRQWRGIFLAIASARGSTAFQFHQALGDKDSHLAQQISLKQPVITLSRTYTMRWGTSPRARMTRDHGEVMEAESFVMRRWEPSDENTRGWFNENSQGRWALLLQALRGVLEELECRLGIQLTKEKFTSSHQLKKSPPQRLASPSQKLGDTHD